MCARKIGRVPEVLRAQFVQAHRSSHQRCSIKRSVLKNSIKFTEKQLCTSEFCEIFKNKFFAEHLWTTALASARDPCGLETFTKSHPKQVLAEPFVKLCTPI